MISDLRQSLNVLENEAKRKDYPPEKVDSVRLGIFKEFVRREHERLRYEHQAGASGRSVVNQWTGIVDALITEAYRMVLLDHEDDATVCAIVALGGYGRGALNIASDVDILFVFRDSVPADSPIVKGVLHLLWDLDFDLGHATRTIDQALAFAQSDDIGCTAMVDARYLAGYEPLFRDFERAFREKYMGNDGREFADRKIAQMRERRKAFGGYAQVLEPNVKESTGGLRDIHTMQWIMRACWGTSALESLVERRVLARQDYRALEEAIDLLWRARNELHFIHRRKHDRLDFDVQPKLAAAFKYDDTTDALGVEEFMRDYYLAARTVVQIADEVSHELTRSVSRATQVVDLVRRRVLPDGVVYVRGKLLLPRARRSFFDEDPFRLLTIFADKQRTRATMGESTARTLHQALDLVTDEYRHDPRAARIFLDILGDPAYLGTVLRRMHWVGLLGAYLPEFDRLTCLVQHDYYHAYTADEHSIICVQRLSELAEYKEPLPKIAAVYRSIARKELLHLAALLHDVGKSGGHGHAERGAEMSGEITRRLGLAEHDQDLVAFVIAHHLELSHISQRRDIDDQSMIETVAAKFNDTTSLDMLYVLTWADMNATQTERVSDWKTGLLDTLHHRLHEAVERRGHGPRERMMDVLESPHKYRDQLAERVGAEAADRHLSGMPRRYSLIYSLDEATRHAGRAEEVGDAADGVVVDADPEPEGTRARVTIYTRDRAFLLSDICGVLAVNDLNILYADAYTRSDGIIVDMFGVEGMETEAEARAAQIAQLRETFDAVWKGRANVVDLIAHHRRRWARRKVRAKIGQTHVVFDNQISEPYTVIDVFTNDRIGLLHDISRTISSQGLDIHMARIGTDADRVADAFYITAEDGRKLTDLERAERVRTALLDALQLSRP